jgi:hypothetical protein
MMEHIKWSSLLVLFLVVITIGLLKGQQLIPRFETAFYFEDAIGNKDTVHIGYDLEATKETDAAFGEVEYNAPFDSIFDVRVKDPNSFTGNLYKRLITKSTVVFNDPDSCLSGGGGEVFIHSIYQPIKVSWDQMIFYDSICYRGGFVIDHVKHEVTWVSPDNFPPLYYCLADVEEGYFELPSDDWENLEARLRIEHEVEGLGVQEIFGLAVVVGPVFLYTPCYWITDVMEAEGGNVASVKLFPNPTSGEISIQIEQNISFQELILFNSIGSPVEKFSWNLNEAINISGHPAGIYYLAGSLADGSLMYLGRVVKI